MSPKALILIRGLFNLAFGAVLLWLAQDSSVHGYQRAAFYAVVDGLLGIALAWAISRLGLRLLASLAGADGLIRVLLGLVLLADPWLYERVLGNVVLSTGLILLCIALGAFGLISAAVNRKAPSRGAGVAESALASGPIVAISVCTLLLGVGIALEFLEHDRRVFLALYALAVGAVYGFAGWRLPRH